MGEEYKTTLKEKIKEFGEKELRVYINEEGVDPHYLLHLEETFREAGVKFVKDREEANFIFDGNSPSSNYRKGQVVAFFKGRSLAFNGTL